MAEINLLQFFKTGRFGAVQLGTTRANVNYLLGLPDNILTPDIWEYGGVELHFDPSQSTDPNIHPLTRITFSPLSLATPEQWQTDISPWIFGSYFGPTRQELKNALMQAAISYTECKQPTQTEKRNGRHLKTNWLYTANPEISGSLYLLSGVSATYSADDLVINVQISQ